MACNCTAGALSCINRICQCRPTFFGPSCQFQLYEVTPQLFYVSEALPLALHIIAFVAALVLIMYYFQRYLGVVGEKNRIRNPQILGVLMICIACGFRVIYGLVNVIIGASVYRLYFVGPSAVQVISRFTYGLFFPFTIGSYALNIILWMDLVYRTRYISSRQAMWLPQFQLLFLCVFCCLLLLEFIVESLLCADVSPYAVSIAYRSILATVLLAMIFLATIMGVKVLRLLDAAQSKQQHMPSASSARIANSRAVLTRLIVASNVLLGAAFILATTLAALPMSSAASYYGPVITLRFVELMAAFTLIGTLFVIMQNRMSTRTATSDLTTVDDPNDTAITSSTMVSSSVNNNMADMTIPLIEASPFSGYEDDHVRF